MEKNYEVTIVDGKITALTVDRKAIAMRDLNKAQNSAIWKLYTDAGIASNPFSGVEMELDPLEFSIFKFCIKWYRAYEAGISAGYNLPPIQVFDTMKYLLLKINAEAYMNLLD
jgi:hypothetical protein